LTALREARIVLAPMTMLWTAYPETKVTQLTCQEWLFSLGAGREVQIGYSIRVGGAWELFGNGHWVWFTGAVVSFDGAVQPLLQWAEVEPLGPRNRVWHWVHWRNPGKTDVVVRPYLVLVPPISDSWLMQSEQLNVRKHIWTLVDLVSAKVAAIGSVISGDDDAGGGAGGGGGGGGKDGLVPAMTVRPLARQRLREVELADDLCYLPPQELWARLTRRPRPATFPATRRRPEGGRRRDR
jgi:hypothetical protein